MKLLQVIVGIGFCSLAISAISQKAPEPYVQEIEAWQKRREASLKSENGWLNLVGLFWLQPGENSFGSGKKNSIVFPEGSIAAEAGQLLQSGNTVQLLVKQGSITVDGKPVVSALVFHPDSTHRPVMASGNLRWNIIQRDDKLGIRLRDLSSSHVADFKGIERYAIDSNWLIKAHLHKPAIPVQIMITNVLGQTTPEPSPGKLMFSIQGQQYSLDALEEYGELFILFADETSGRDTYGAGRFLKAKMPGPDGITFLDFNKAYNPPCAFTPYATCPLPPSQNVLPVAVRAGEKNYEY
jgi:uncharacterized protein (DUF1684 family)